MATRERSEDERQQLPLDWDSEGREEPNAAGLPDDHARQPTNDAVRGEGNHGSNLDETGIEQPGPPPQAAAVRRRAQSSRGRRSPRVGEPEGEGDSQVEGTAGAEGQPDEAEPASQQAPEEPQEESPFRQPSAGVGMGFAYTARYMRQRERILRGMPSGPPRHPWDDLRRWFDDQGPARVSLTLLFLGALLLAVYLGLALGDSIEGGTGKPAQAGLAALPTTTPGVGQIACGSGAYTIGQGQTYSLTFDSKALAGYQISNLTVLPVSANASAQSLEAQARPPFAVEVNALVLPGSAGRTDEYRLGVTFSKPGERDVTSECIVLVQGPSATPTAQPSPTSAPAFTPTQRPVVPTPPPATQTPVPAVSTTTNTQQPSPTRTSTPSATSTRTAVP